jgi:hypothetical protein
VSEYLAVAYRRALANADPALVQLWFDSAVVQRYRERGDFQLIRTDTAGRVRKQGGWSLDVGIADDGSVHASWQTLAYGLPEEERAHWAAHAVAAAGVSANFLRMQLSPGSCFDDGELRTWE